MPRQRVGDAVTRKSHFSGRSLGEQVLLGVLSELKHCPRWKLFTPKYLVIRPQGWAMRIRVPGTGFGSEIKCDVYQYVPHSLVSVVSQSGSRLEHLEITFLQLALRVESIGLVKEVSSGIGFAYLLEKGSPVVVNQWTVRINLKSLPIEHLR